MASKSTEDRLSMALGDIITQGRKGKGGKGKGGKNTVVDGNNAPQLRKKLRQSIKKASPQIPRRGRGGRQQSGRQQSQQQQQQQQQRQRGGAGRQAQAVKEERVGKFSKSQQARREDRVRQRRGLGGQQQQPRQQQQQQKQKKKNKPVSKFAQIAKQQTGARQPRARPAVPVVRRPRDIKISVVNNRNGARRMSGGSPKPNRRDAAPLQPIRVDHRPLDVQSRANRALGIRGRGISKRPRRSEIPANVVASALAKATQQRSSQTAASALERKIASALASSRARSTAGRRRR